SDLENSKRKKKNTKTIRIVPKILSKWPSSAVTKNQLKNMDQDFSCYLSERAISVLSFYASVILDSVRPN
ncbi:MAG: hypothetical protein VX367_01330, partial [SAR324 cluster bacterium]|nr:hypothetical protein [SAR324 cluster bacterium]